MKVELEKYIGKEVKIVLKTGETFIGKVDDTSDAEENQRPFDSIEIWSNGKGLGFYEDEIESIVIINT